MRKGRYLYFVFALLGTSLVLLSGCARTAPSRFYLLNALPAAASEQQNREAEQGIAIGIGPVEIPEYLDRPQIVTRSSLNKLELAEFDRWAEPLNQNFSRVLTENLSILLSTDRIAVYPWRSSAQVDYKVAIYVTRFDGTLGANALLIARWTVFGKNGKKVLLRRTSSYSEPVEKQNYEALVVTKSRMLVALSRDIASAIKTISQKQPVP